MGLFHNSARSHVEHIFDLIPDVLTLHTYQKDVRAELQDAVHTGQLLKHDGMGDLAEEATHKLANDQDHRHVETHDPGGTENNTHISALAGDFTTGERHVELFPWLCAAKTKAESWIRSQNWTNGRMTVSYSDTEPWTIFSLQFKSKDLYSHSIQQEIVCKPLTGVLHESFCYITYKRRVWVLTHIQPRSLGLVDWLCHWIWLWVKPHTRRTHSRRWQCPTTPGSHFHWGSRRSSGTGLYSGSRLHYLPYKQHVCVIKDTQLFCQVCDCVAIVIIIKFNVGGTSRVQDDFGLFQGERWIRGYTKTLHTFMQ